MSTDGQPLPTPPSRPAFLLNVGGGGSLKSKQRKSFIDENLEDLIRIERSPTDLLREVDQLRMYTPFPVERARYRIPESVDRLNLHSVNHIMLLCGGCACVRFSTDVRYDSVKSSPKYFRT